MTLPANIPKRGLSVEEAAEYCGVSTGTLTRHGPPATRIGGRNVYDRIILDQWLDRLGGVVKASTAEHEATAALEKAIHARKDSLRHRAS